MYGRLIREDNKSLDKTYVYEYNDNGNVACVKTYGRPSFYFRQRTITAVMKVFLGFNM